MNRISLKELESLVSVLNEELGKPRTAYSKDENRKITPNPGNFHLDGSYGGWELHKMCKTGTGVSTPLNTGYISKGQLYALISAMLVGIREVKRD